MWRPQGLGGNVCVCVPEPVVSWALVKLGWMDHYIDFLGDGWNARFSTIAANVWREYPPYDMQ